MVSIPEHKSKYLEAIILDGISELNTKPVIKTIHLLEWNLSQVYLNAKWCFRCFILTYIFPNGHDDT